MEFKGVGNFPLCKENHEIGVGIKGPLVPKTDTQKGCKHVLTLAKQAQNV
jgi:hypothetical protein